jgi:lipoyl-dependent peroxiredoxin
VTLRTSDHPKQKERNTHKLAKVIYTAKTHTAGGKDGASRSSGGRLEVKLSSPGAPGAGTKR